MNSKPISHFSIIDYESLYQTFPEKYHHGYDGGGKCIVTGSV
jgi:hypothetical protein